MKIKKFNIVIFSSLISLGALRDNNDKYMFKQKNDKKKLVQMFLKG